MAGPDRTNAPATKRSEQHIQNMGFDETYQIPAVMLVAEYNGALYRVQVDETGQLKVAGLEGGGGSDGTAVIIDGVDPTKKATVDGNGRLEVKVANGEDGSSLGKAVLTNNNNNAQMDIDPSGHAFMNFQSDTVSVSSVNASTSSVTVKAANENRQALIIHNNSTDAMYIRYGDSAAAATLGSYTYKLASGEHHEVKGGWRGEVRAIWAGTNSGASVTELTS